MGKDQRRNAESRLAVLRSVQGHDNSVGSCSACGAQKTVYVGRTRLHYVCRPCNTKRHREWVDANLDRARRIKRESAARNPRAISESQKGRYRAGQYQKRKFKYPEKVAAEIAFKSAVRAGTLHKGRCAICGATDVHGHHEDYSLPLDVVWLCRKHHYARHRKSDRIELPEGIVNGTR